MRKPTCARHRYVIVHTKWWINYGCFNSHLHCGTRTRPARFTFSRRCTVLDSGDQYILLFTIADPSCFYYSLICALIIVISSYMHVMRYLQWYNVVVNYERCTTFAVTSPMRISLLRTVLVKQFLCDVFGLKFFSRIAKNMSSFLKLRHC